jgi:hypothetical protein
MDDGASRPTRAVRKTADRIRRYRVLQPVLAGGRGVRAAHRRVTAPGGIVRRASARTVLAVRAVPARMQRSRRRAALEAAVGALGPVRADAPAASIVPADTTTDARMAVASSTGTVIAFVPSTTTLVDPAAIDRLADAIAHGAVGATPRTVHPARPPLTATPDDLHTRALGYDVVVAANGAPQLQARAAGAPVPVRAGPPERVAAGSPALFAVDRAAHDAVGGLDAVLPFEAAIVDLSVRLGALGSVVAVPGALVVDARPVTAGRDDVFGARPQAWNALVARRGPALVRAAHGDAHVPTIVITTAVPSRKIAARWGDWHFAGDLARALRNLGFAVRVQTLDQADSDASRAADAHIVVRGLAPVRRTSGQVHVLWVISHPETIDVHECEAADHVFVASARFAADLRTRTGTPVDTLWQATDHHRFRPRPPDPRYAHELAVVAKTRTVMRPMVADALAAGLRPAIYGSGWEEFVDPELVVADYVDNDELPLVYASTGVLLNDHWDTMRSWGFVSNRIFDALACGTPVVSDQLPEIEELFDGAVPTVEGPSALRATVDDLVARPEAARDRAGHGREQVLAAHTFEHRAQAIARALAAQGVRLPL